MKLSVVALVFAAAVQAQSLKDIPACAVPCLEASVKKKTSCQTTDLRCVCKPENFSKIRDDATSCVITRCGAETGKVIEATQKLCKSVGGK
ncbi:CFEM domain-containing protein [Hirsutella rhossiliensis]|uniref:CFEM domain-containing protein n=1 Tax=Hirsutella rhossiliensis TaxID=111463 RepID=A0A9P8SIX2_9HYPO|nr:CFEM domain-containing protein [Hirsutella rhossiliensis]KAH0964668.1 CFEM domain-containing protein [Hirsutella rhossiliensis]